MTDCYDGAVINNWILSVMFKRSLFFSFLTLFFVTGCETTPPPIKDGQYWQRVNATEAIYLQGPKAQQMLNRDIGRCVTALRELERLGQIKDAIPTDHHGRVLNPDEKAMHNWETPHRDGQLFTEHDTFQDFESCMYEKGWERIKFVPYDVARRAEENYYRTHIDYKDTDFRQYFEHQKGNGDSDDYENLNS